MDIEKATGWLPKTSWPCFCEDKVNGCRVKLCHWSAVDGTQAEARRLVQAKARKGVSDRSARSLQATWLRDEKKRVF